MHTYKVKTIKRMETSTKLMFFFMTNVNISFKISKLDEDTKIPH